MKIKTITCHDVNNFGASLQAYALSFYLSQLGHDVEVINYMPKYLSVQKSLFFIGKKWKRNFILRLIFYCYVVPIRLIEYRSRQNFYYFLEKYVKRTKRYTDLGQLKKDIPSADVSFCGSDQIWNTMMENGKDPAFYLDFYNGTSCIKASYAASFATKEVDSLYKDFVREKVSNLDFISVREKSALGILEELGIYNGLNVIDPVFLPSEEHWSTLTEKVKYKKYILVYDQEMSESIKYVVKELSKKYSLKIIAIRTLYPMLYADKQILTAGPIQFISLIKNATFVVSNSFHCMSFSLIFQRNFLIVPRDTQKVNSRMMDLLEYLDIKDHFLSNINSWDKVSNINYENVASKLKSLKKSSYNYIDSVLEYAKMTKEKNLGKNSNSVLSDISMRRKV